MKQKVTHGLTDIAGHVMLRLERAGTQVRREQRVGQSSVGVLSGERFLREDIKHSPT